MVLAIDLLITIYFGFLGIFPIITTLFGLLDYHIPWQQILTTIGKLILTLLLTIVIAIFVRVSFAEIKQSLCSHAMYRKDKCTTKCIKCGKEYESHDWKFSEDGHSKTCNKCHRWESDGWTTEPQMGRY